MSLLGRTYNKINDLEGSLATPADVREMHYINDLLTGGTAERPIDIIQELWMAGHTEAYQPKYKWRRTKIDDNDVPTDLDWTGLDGTEYLGRIRKETDGPTKGKWHWAGSWPRTYMGRPPTPNAGYVDTARQATQKVEEYWELCHEVMTPRSESR